MATETGEKKTGMPAADSHDRIRVVGARVNNLKDISIDLPKRRLTVFTGVSGSSKSVIVFARHQAVMAHADWIIDLGPGAGHDGGEIVFSGTPADLVAQRTTISGKHLAAYVGAWQQGVVRDVHPG